MPVSATPHLLVSVLSVHRKRAHSPSSKDEHSIGLKDSLLAHSSDPVEMRRLNYQTPGKEQLTPLRPTSSSSPSPGPHARGGVAVLPNPSSSAPSQSQWHRGGLDRGYPGVRLLVCKSFSLAPSLQARKAGEPGWGQPIVCLCVRHYLKLTAVALSREEPPRRVGRAHKCPHLHCSQVLRWLGPRWDSVLSTTGTVLAPGAASGRNRRYREPLYC